GGFFLTADDDEKLLARLSPAEDGAEPSGNSVTALNLLRLAELTGDERYRVRAERLIGAFGGILADHPTALPEMLLAVDSLTDALREIVLTPPHRREELAGFLTRLNQVYLPNRVLVQAVEGEDGRAASALVPLLSDREALRGKATAYVCLNRACR